MIKSQSQQLFVSSLMSFIIIWFEAVPRQTQNKSPDKIGLVLRTRLFLHYLITSDSFTFLGQKLFCMQSPILFACSSQLFCYFYLFISFIVFMLFNWERWGWGKFLEGDIGDKHGFV